MTLTVVAVFLPIAFVSGLIGRIFSQFGLTVTAAVALSLIEAFTLAPMLSAHWFKQRKEKGPKPLPDGNPAAFRSWYVPEGVDTGPSGHRNPENRGPKKPYGNKGGRPGGAGAGESDQTGGARAQHGNAAQFAWNGKRQFREG